MDIAKLKEWKAGTVLLYMLGITSYNVTDSFPGQSNILSFQPMLCRQLSPDPTNELTKEDEFVDSLSMLSQLETDLSQAKYQCCTMKSLNSSLSETSLSRKPRNGDRVLCLDGGGIKGLVLIEMLSAIERVTGKRIIELFDWFVGTSTGGILTLALVYSKLNCNLIIKYGYYIMSVLSHTMYTEL